MFFFPARIVYTKAQNSFPKLIFKPASSTSLLSLLGIYATPTISNRNYLSMRSLISYMDHHCGIMSFDVVNKSPDRSL